MKRSTSLLFLLLCFIVTIMNMVPEFPPPSPEILSLCKKVNTTHPLNYLGKSLTVHSEDPADLPLCEGDAFGDLNETYIAIQNCTWKMYHKGKMIWSKGRNDYDDNEMEGYCRYDGDCFCMFYLKRDGDIEYYKEELRDFFWRDSWPDSTYHLSLDPVKTELRVEGQQLQIFQTYKDGTHRLFYIDENNLKFFVENMGEPVKKADEFIIKSHSDEDKTILRRNQYIGDINGAHLILNPECEFLLLNKKKVIWSLTSGSSFRHQINNCTLNIGKDNTIEIGWDWDWHWNCNRNWNWHCGWDWKLEEEGPEYFTRGFMEARPDLEVIESKITLGESSPIIIQTLKNGSELTFYGGRLKREPKQIAQKRIITLGNDRSEIKRMEYIGNLTGLHLILEQNCILILAHGDEKLWEYQTASREDATECKVSLSSKDISLQRDHYISGSLIKNINSRVHDWQIFTGVELALENDHIVFKRTRKDRDVPEIVYAGRQTNDSFFQFIAQSSVVVNNKYNYDDIEILPQMGYIGDLHGIFVLLDENCNLALYNKTQILWESNSSVKSSWSSCSLKLDSDGQVKISKDLSRYGTLWSAVDIPPHINFGQILKTELSVADDNLWLIYTFRDGTIIKEQAIKGTNRFTNNLARSQPPSHSSLDKLMFCKEKKRNHSVRFQEVNLTTKFDDEKDIVLCPGDTFGDLNETYVAIKKCYIAMYHKNQAIWTTETKTYLRNDKLACAFSLERYGNLVLYEEGFINNRPAFIPWDAQINLNPSKTVLRVYNQQIQIVQTFADGTQRLFYADANHQVFTEDMGEPRKIAHRFISKSHSTEDKVILRRNEYIGDLNGTQLILQPNCSLHLSNKNDILWSFIPAFKHQTNCTLSVASDNTLEISSILYYERSSIMKHPESLDVAESHISFEGDQPRIIQILKNGSELIFCGSGLNHGLNLKTELKQIAQKTLIVEEPDSPEDSHINTLELRRMEYLGNLTGLHLVLEQNCSLILADGNEKLWEKAIDSEEAVTECHLKLSSEDIWLERSPYKVQSLIKTTDSRFFHKGEIIGIELTLENNQMEVKRKRKDRDFPEIFHAGRQTDNSFFQFIALNSTVANYSYQEVPILTPNSYIGDLNGVFVMLGENCNLALYTKTQVLWESNSSLARTSDSWTFCSLKLDENGQVKISKDWSRYGTLWSAVDIPPHINFGQILKTELSVADDNLWLIYTFRDGTIIKEQAIKGTNRFTNNLAQSQPPYHSTSEKLMFCKERKRNHSVHFQEVNLTTKFDDEKDIVLCPGDTFGDLNETYVAIKKCYIAMYHKNQTIWTSEINPDDSLYLCAFSLRRDGNLVLYQRGDEGFWEAQTNLNPLKTELRVLNQQFQIVQTFRDETQRLFYADANHQEFTEDMGEPRKIADRFISKSHSTEDKVILRRNEYIGDLNGTHLILQPNCSLHLSNKNETIWAFASPFRHKMNCTLDIAQGNTLEISSILADRRRRIIIHQETLEVLKSQITFENDQPIIIQTLQNGSELIFCGSGLNNGLSLKRELRQIAQKTITGKDDFLIQRNDYIGNLTGLHLILQQNCSLILANGNQKLWEFQTPTHPFNYPLMECSLRLDSGGEMYLNREFTEEDYRSFRQTLLVFSHLLNYGTMTGVELTLENDQILVKQEYSNRDPVLLYAGPKTDGAFFQFIARNSVLVSDDGIILPQMGYIGDLNEVYTVLDKNCNWVLRNRTRLLWQSGTFKEIGYNPNDNFCTLTKRNKELRIEAKNRIAFLGPDFIKTNIFKKAIQIEVLLKESELWVVHTFQDGSVQKYKAVSGTNGFELVSKTDDFSFNGDL